ncbi:MAG: B12-binding domain-containing radical SAM protein [Chitinispirillaceae bacterium]
MNIVLFHPRGYDNTDGKTSLAHKAVKTAPIGLASIAAVLKKQGHQVTIYDAHLFARIPNSRWIEKIIDCNPDFVGFSATTQSFLDAYSVAAGIKEKQSDISIVFGGAHVSWGQEELMRQYPAIDYIVAGEGEFAFAELAEGKNQSRIEGLIYRNGSRVESGPPRTALCTMDELPFPAYDLLDGFARKYELALFNYASHPGATVISSRGCVYNCSYCDRSVFQKSFRWNSPEYTFELVKWLHTDFGIRHVIFYDDLFTLNRKRVSRLCSLLRQSTMKIRFNCIVRIGHIDNDLIQELKSAGCWMVHVGIESGDQKILDQHKQALSLEDIRRDINLIYDSGLWVKGLFMMGFPGESEESIQKTIDFACSLPLKDVNVTAFTPFPGAPITANIQSLGQFENDWEKMDCVNFVFVPNQLNSKETLQEYYGLFIRKFYNRPFMRKIYRRMLWESPHSYWRLVKHAGAFLSYASRLKT